MTNKEKILAMYPGSLEMPDPSGCPSADYCIVRPATKEDWPENRWVEIGPYVSGNPWDAAWRKINEDLDLTEVWYVCAANNDISPIPDGYYVSHEDYLSVKRELAAAKGQ